MAQGPPEPLKAPDYQSRDSTDPMSPEHYRMLEATAQDSIRAYERLKYLNRNMYADPTYRKIHTDLVHAAQDQLAYIHLIKKELESKARFKDLYSKLDMKRHENIQAYEKACEDEIKIQDLLNGATDIYNQLKARL